MAFFIDKDSISFPDKNTVQIWYKAIPTDEAEFKGFTEWLELREVDCTRRRYKTLQGHIWYPEKPEEQLHESGWEYLQPGQLYDAFYHTACSQRKQKSSK